MLVIFSKIARFLKIQEDTAELLDAHRHLAPQDAGGYRDSSLLKNVGATASATRVPSSKTRSSSWDFSLIAQSWELKIKKIIKLTNNKAFRQQQALSPSFDELIFSTLDSLHCSLIKTGVWGHISEEQRAVPLFFQRTVIN